MEAHAWKKGDCLTAPPDTFAGEWESRIAYARAPWQVPPTVIILEQEDARKQHDDIVLKQDSLVVYTDGSGYGGRKVLEW